MSRVCRSWGMAGGTLHGCGANPRMLDLHGLPAPVRGVHMGSSQTGSSRLDTLCDKAPRFRRLAHEKTGQKASSLRQRSVKLPPPWIPALWGDPVHITSTQALTSRDKRSCETKKISRVRRGVSFILSSYTDGLLSFWRAVILGNRTLVIAC